MAGKDQFDVIVVGAGHAGVEAALACARMGLSVLVVSNNFDRVSFMSCNPSIGGLGKGHMVREIDALGGEMGRAADKTCIQFKRLNSRKGPAVRGSRAQCDKDLYSQYMGNYLLSHQGISTLEQEVKEVILESGVCRGVRTSDGSEARGKAVILTTGTFMGAVMHIGHEQVSGGRVGEAATEGLSAQLAAHGFSVMRLKTGTPPRLHKDSIDWSKTTPQYGDERFMPFSFRSSKELQLEQIACFSTFTNEQTHDVIRKNLDKSPMFSGAIEGIGPRYCPSIEDKITRFQDRDKHLTFLEPEGLSTDSIYLQGISTSLPEDVQYEFLRTIPGLKDVKVLRPGYAVEYDFFEPTQIWHTLETRGLQNLYFAGQINGTSGYEEAAVQGLVAGINAALKIKGEGEFVLGRDQAYFAVLIDDLVTKGTREPYRMMTSRAEHRLVLREDNVTDRLSKIGKNLGLLTDQEFDHLASLSTQKQDYHQALRSKVITPTEATCQILTDIGTSVIQKPTTLEQLLRRNEVSSFDLSEFDIEVPKDELVREPVEIEVKYAGYIRRQQDLISQTKKLESLLLPTDMEFDCVRGLSTEEVEKLSRVRPRTLGQAQRISGVNPSAVQALLVYLKGQERRVGEQKVER